MNLYKHTISKTNKNSNTKRTFKETKFKRASNFYSTIVNARGQQIKHLQEFENLFVLKSEEKNYFKWNVNVTKNDNNEQNE